MPDEALRALDRARAEPLAGEGAMLRIGPADAFELRAGGGESAASLAARLYQAPGEPVTEDNAVCPRSIEEIPEWWRLNASNRQFLDHWLYRVAKFVAEVKGRESGRGPGALRSSLIRQYDKHPDMIPDDFAEAWKLHERQRERGRDKAARLEREAERFGQAELTAVPAFDAGLDHPRLGGAIEWARRRRHPVTKLIDAIERSALAPLRSSLDAVTDACDRETERWKERPMDGTDLHSPFVMKARREWLLAVVRISSQLAERSA